MDMKTKSAQQTNGTLLRTICLILSMVMLLFAATGCDDSNEDKVYSRTCRVCGKTYSYRASEYGNSAYENCKSIQRTNMCLKCYRSFKYSMEILGNDTEAPLPKR